MNTVLSYVFLTTIVIIHFIMLTFLELMDLQVAETLLHAECYMQTTTGKCRTP